MTYTYQAKCDKCLWQGPITKDFMAAHHLALGHSKILKTHPVSVLTMSEDHDE